MLKKRDKVHTNSDIFFITWLKILKEIENKYVMW